jgi:hypothetical protein
VQAALAAQPDASPETRWSKFDLQWLGSNPPSVVRLYRAGDTFVATRAGDPRELKFPIHIANALDHSLLAWLTTIAAPVSGNPSMGTAEGMMAARFDESLDMFRSVTGRQRDLAVVNPDLRPVVELSQYIGKDETSSERRTAFPIEGLVPRRILRLVEERFVEGATDVSFEKDDLQFLSETVRLLGLRSATAKLEFTGKGRARGNGTFQDHDLLWFGNLNFWFTRKDGSVFQHHHLSYGQKRLLAFLYYLDANPSFVLADELVNGLHHTWIDECMKALGDRQAFLTSQNPLLLDYLVFHSAEDVKQSFILCSSKTIDGRERMTWRNMTDDEAAMFYSAYQVGIEHVGEILRTRGLW